MGKDKPDSDGKSFPGETSGAEIFFMNKRNYDFVNEIMQEESEILRIRGRNVYVIPEAGSTTRNMAYFSLSDELSKQINIRQLDGILVAAGK